MNTQTIDFTQLAQWQQSASRNKALVRILRESANDVFASHANPILLAFHETSIAAVYQQFGFAVFSPESRRLLALEQARHSKVSSRLLLEWLDLAAYQQLADFHVLKYLESEPDWLELDHEFLMAVVQRVVVCRPQEWGSVGLSHYPAEALETLMRVVDLQMMNMRQGLQTEASANLLRRFCEENSSIQELLGNSIPLWGKTIDQVLHRIEQDPLRLLAWRLEALSTERQLSNDARLAVRTVSQSDMETRCLAVISLMIVLAGYSFSGFGPVVSETPVTFSQVSKSLATFFATSNQHEKVIRELLGFHSEKPALQEILQSVFSTGEQLGVFQWVAVAKGQRGVLLTSLAILVMEPYRELIESIFCLTEAN